eukprot:SAG25_NODE_10388_length_336_cov_1.008439_1_plen_105_part_01
MPLLSDAPDTGAIEFPSILDNRCDDAKRCVKANSVTPPLPTEDRLAADQPVYLHARRSSARVLSTTRQALLVRIKDPVHLCFVGTCYLSSRVSRKVLASSEKKKK